MKKIFLMLPFFAASIIINAQTDISRVSLDLGYITGYQVSIDNNNNINLHRK